MTLNLPDFIQNLKNDNPDDYDDIERVSFQSPVNLIDMHLLPKNLSILCFYYYSFRSPEFKKQYEKSKLENFSENEDLVYKFNIPEKQCFLYEFKAELFPSNITELTFYNCELRKIISLPPKLKRLNVERNYLLQELPEIPTTVEHLSFRHTNIKNVVNFPPKLNYISFTKWFSEILDLSIFPDSLEDLYLIDNTIIKEIIVSGRKPKKIFDKKIIYCNYMPQLECVCSEIENFIADERMPEDTLKLICEQNKENNLKHPLSGNDNFEYKCLDCKNYMSNYYSFPNLPGNITNYCLIDLKTKDTLCEYCFNYRDESKRNNFVKCNICTFWLSYSCDYCNKEIEAFDEVYNIICNKKQTDVCGKCIHNIDLVNDFVNQNYVPVKIKKTFNCVKCFDLEDNFSDTDSNSSDDSNSLSDQSIDDESEK
jgi:hypothetical protein